MPVMDLADKKEQNDIVREVGSASSWGAKERERFNIPERATEIDVKRLIGEEWFQFEKWDDEYRIGKSLLNNG